MLVSKTSPKKFISKLGRKWIKLNFDAVIKSFKVKKKIQDLKRLKGSSMLI